MITAVDLRLTGLLIVLHLLYFIHVASNICYNLLQNLLYFLPENTYFLEFLKSYILIEVDSEHWLTEAFTTRLPQKNVQKPSKKAKNTAAGTNILPPKAKVLLFSPPCTRKLAFYTWVALSLGLSQG